MILDPRSKQLLKGIPKVLQSAMKIKLQLCPQAYLGLMVSAAIVGGIVLVVDREMLESSFQGLGSHGCDVMIESDNQCNYPFLNWK